MKAILLAAGFGTRLRPLTETVPKCLVPIGGVPLLHIWLDQIFNSSIHYVLINTHYLSSKVEDFLNGSKYKGRVRLSHENELLGTAGTIFKNMEFIGGEPVIVIHADNLSKFDVDEFIMAHKSRPTYCNMTMMLFETDDPKSCGIVELDETGVVIEFHEKSSEPPSSIANAAIYILEPELISEFNAKSPQVTDISTQIIPNNLGRIFTYLNTEYHRDIGTLESLRLANLEYRG